MSAFGKENKIFVEEKEAVKLLTFMFLFSSFHLAFKRLFRVHWHVDWIYHLTKDYKKDEKLREEIYQYGDEVKYDSLQCLCF